MLRILFAVGRVFTTLIVLPVALLAQQVYTPGNGVTAPRAVAQVMPERSVKARVILECVVQTDGRVTDITVTRPADEETNAAAVNALRLWTFEPGTKDGKPVAVRFHVQLQFRERP